MKNNEIRFSPVARVSNSRKSPEDDYWGRIVSEIALEENIPTTAFDGIVGFSHLEIIFYFDQSNPHDVVFSGRPRGNPEFPVLGIFAQRKRDRPNAIGLCTVELIGHSGRKITVKNLDAIDGTPILDIKPVYREFQPKGEIRQPDWVTIMMKDYWNK